MEDFTNAEVENIGPEFDLTDMATAVAGKTGYSAKTCREVLEAFAATLPDALVAHQGRMEFHGLGVFRIEERAPRKGVTPDGQQWEKPNERQEVVFHAAPAINTALTERTGVETYSA
jgi:nucleoid DNA-binding protein